MSLQIRPLHNKIFFQFEERIIENAKGVRSFETKSDGGVVVLGSNEDATKKPRWCKVLAVGPKVDDSIKVGMRVCVEALRWTDPVTVDGVEFWQTNDEEILVICTEAHVGL